MKRKVSILIIIMIILFSVCIASACIPNRIEEYQITLPTVNTEQKPIIVGNYDLTRKTHINNSVILYGVKEGEQDKLIDIFRNSEYFLGEYEVFKTEYLESRHDDIYVGQNSLWLGDGKNIWACQAYGKKRVRVVGFDTWTLFNDDKQVTCDISRVLFASAEYSRAFDVDYQTPFSWSQFKSFYSSDRVNEKEKSIVVDCQYKKGDELFSYGKGKTKLFFNENGNSFNVSSDFEITE